MKRFYFGSGVVILIFLIMALYGSEPTPTTLQMADNLNLDTSTSLPSLAWRIVLALGLILFFNAIGGINMVAEWNRRPYMKFGKYQGDLKPGVSWINPAVYYALDDVSMRSTTTKVEIEDVQTQDNVPLRLDLLVTRRISDVRKSVLEVEDLNDSVIERAIASANGTIRAYDLAEILGKGHSFPDQILDDLKAKVLPWGTEVIAVEIRNLEINDEEIQQAIATKARAQKEAEAQMTRAVMQEQVVTELNKAAETLTEKGWQLKRLETLLELCRSANNNTILIPTELQSLVNVFASGAQ